MRIQTLIDLALQNGVELPSYTEEGLREKVFKDKYKDLVDYLQGFFFNLKKFKNKKGFGYIGSVLCNPEALERVAYEFAVDNYNEGVFYFEARFAPQVFLFRKLI